MSDSTLASIVSYLSSPPLDITLKEPQTPQIRQEWQLKCTEQQKNYVCDHRNLLCDHVSLMRSSLLERCTSLTRMLHEHVVYAAKGLSRMCR